MRVGHYVTVKDTGNTIGTMYIRIEDCYLTKEALIEGSRKKSEK